MAMSKQDFIALVDAVCTVKRRQGLCGSTALINTSGAVAVDELALELARVCAAQNPAFNRERWFGYINDQCGPSGGVVGGAVRNKLFNEREGTC